MNTGHATIESWELHRCQLTWRTAESIKKKSFRFVFYYHDKERRNTHEKRSFFTGKLFKMTV